MATKLLGVLLIAACSYHAEAKPRVVDNPKSIAPLAAFPDLLYTVWGTGLRKCDLKNVYLCVTECVVPWDCDHPQQVQLAIRQGREREHNAESERDGTFETWECANEGTCWGTHPSASEHLARLIKNLERRMADLQAEINSAKGAR